MAKNIKRHISHLKSSGSSAPQATDLVYGEIAVGYAAGNEKLFIKNSSDDVITFESAVNAQALAETYTDKRVVTKVTGDSEISVTLSDISDTGRTITVTHASGSSQSGFKKLESDSYGHITGGSNVTLSDLTALGAVSSARTVSAGTGLTGGGDLSEDITLSLATTGTSGTYGPSANVTGTEGTTIKVPQITVDDYGRVTAVTERTLTNKDTTYTVNDGSFTISGDGVSVASTSANASANSGLNIKAGTNVSITTGESEITIAAVDTKYTAATEAPGNVASTSSVGTSTNYARQDHTHGITLATGDGDGQVKVAGTNVSVKGFLSSETLLTSTSNTAIPTSKAVADYVSLQMASALTYKGTVTSNADLPASHKVGDVWVVASGGTYAGKDCEVGDYIICKASGKTASDADWDVINGENQVENKNANLAAAGSSATIATVDGVNITVTTPSTWTGLEKTGTVTKVTAGAGLSGGDITTSGTISLATTGTADTYGPSVNVTGTEGTTIVIPQITTDAYGRVTAVTERTLTNKDTTYTAGTAAVLSAGTATTNSVWSASALKTGGDAVWQAKGNYLTSTTTYAGSSSVGGAANSAEKLTNTTAIGSGTQPVFFTANGVPSATTYSLGASVPSDAKFTDTTYSAGTFISINSSNEISVSTGTTSSTVARGDHSHAEYVNQNAFSNIVVGSTTIAADTATDTVTLATDDNSLTITPDATNDSLTFALGNIECGDYA